SIGASVPSGTRFSFQLELSACQIPDKSGLPSDVRGDAAFKFGFPSGVRGVPGSRTENHCAAAVPAVAQIRNVSTETPLKQERIRAILIGVPILDINLFWFLIGGKRRIANAPTYRPCVRGP